MIWWLFTGIVVSVALCILLASGCMVIVLSATEERGRVDVWLPKVVATLSISCSFSLVLLLPLQRGDESSAIIDGALLICWVACALILAPFAMFHYESWEPEHAAPSSPCSRIMSAAAYTSCVAAVTCGAVVALWLLTGFIQDDVRQAPFVAYCLGLAAAAGWTVFGVFGAIGMSAVPIDGVRWFASRQQRISPVSYQTHRAHLHAVSQRLLEEGRTLAAETAAVNPNAKQQRRMKTFQRDVRGLQEELDALEQSHRATNGSAILPYAVLLLSLASLVFSVLWVAQIVMNALHVNSPFDAGLAALDGFLPSLAILVFSVMSSYLMLCAVVGCWTVGKRCIFFPVFEMRRGATMLNALLFNTLLLMVSSAAVVHLCLLSFPHFLGTKSSLSSYWRVVNECNGIRQVLQYAPHVYVVVSVIAAIWLMCCPERIGLSDEEDDIT